MTINYRWTTTQNSALLALLLFLTGVRGFSGAVDAPMDASASAPIRAACTTTLMGAVIGAVGGDYVEVHAIVPFGMCPGHFDISPGQAAQIRKSDVIFSHGYERFMRNFGTNISGASGSKIVEIKANGNWMVPEIQKSAARNAAKALAAIRPDRKPEFLRNLAAYEMEIDAAVSSLHDMLQSFGGKVVVCSELNAEFAGWLGIKIAAVFPRDEDLSVKSMRYIIAAGRRDGAELVIENRQSSGKIGTTIALELGVPKVVLNNFPDINVKGSAHSPYVETLARNCEALRNALE